MTNAPSPAASAPEGPVMMSPYASVAVEVYEQEKQQAQPEASWSMSVVALAVCGIAVVQLFRRLAA